MEWTHKEVLDMSTKLRTRGDGMEMNVSNESGATKDNAIVVNVQGMKVTTPTRKQQMVIPSRNSHVSPLGVDFPKNLINLTPKEIHYVTKKAKIMSKEPKFVPYEPYKAAIKPIVPITKNKGSERKKASKNNLDLNVLVEQMAMMDTNPITFKSHKKKSSTSSENIVKDDKEIVEDSEKKQWQIEKQSLLNEVQCLKKENRVLHEQITQQAQVNKELKTMLVASMGEDLNATVQTLTEDKQQLASALLNSAQHLSTHQEQTEWLAGQCEVWRSKFLASSLMVEELAGLKAAFTRRTEDLESALRQILEDRNRVRDILIHTYRNLKSLHENWLTNLASKEMYYTSLNELGGFGVIEQTPIGTINLDLSKPKSSNILDLSSVNLKFSENLCNGVEKLDDFTSILNELEVNTDAENMAEKLLAKPLDVCMKNDRPSLALVHHAYTMTGLTPNIACCSHCNGEIQLL